MAVCVIFGGAGFIGTHLARHLLNTGRFRHIYVADVRTPTLAGRDGITCVNADVREPLRLDLANEVPEWIFNLAAVHREPGHSAREYFETNLSGAENVCQYAEDVGCKNIYFTSSISVYGPTTGPTDEDAAICPVSPYGGSKYPAELIHRGWFNSDRARRLVVVRPGVIYGPGDPGNILRMIRAVKRGYFVYPGSRRVHKSYGYIYGLLDSIDFAIEQPDRLITYNYVESPTEPLEDIVQHVKAFLGSRAPLISVPRCGLVASAIVLSAVLGRRTPIHPVRVRKAAMSTHIVPAWLSGRGFAFRYPFLESLRHWREQAPEDFE